MDTGNSRPSNSSRNPRNRNSQSSEKRMSSASKRGEKNFSKDRKDERPDRPGKFRGDKSSDPSGSPKPRVAHDRRSRPTINSKKMERETPKRVRGFIEPEIAPEVSADQLSKRNYYQLKSLAAENAETVAKQLVSIERLLISDQPADWQLADLFGRSAAFRAGRVGVVRRYAGLAALKVGEFERAKRDFRAAFRILGDDAILIEIAETEIGLGQPRKALEILGEVEGRELEFFTRINARLVSAKARIGLAQKDAASVTLNTADERELFGKKYDDSAEAKVLRDRWAETKDLISQL